MIEHYIQLGLALLTGYFCGAGIGYRRANREYKKAIDTACADYKEATRIITKLRNRLRAGRWLELKTAANLAKRVGHTSSGEPT